jgi:hypothetical protein
MEMSEQAATKSNRIFEWVSKSEWVRVSERERKKLATKHIFQHRKKIRGKSKIK